MRTGSLSALKVLDISTVIAGSVASSMFADHGADVTKIEYPGHGDPLRHLEPRKNKVSLWHKVAGRNKKALTLKLSDRRGADLLKRLVADADVLIENFRPGTMEKWGLGWEDLRLINPRLVMVRISGYGQDGPYSTRPGFGTIAESFAGLPLRTGTPDGSPMVSSFPLSDELAGLFAAFSAMFAVFNVDRGTREGQVVDIGLHEPTFRIMEDMVIAYDQLGIVPERMGNRVAWAAPRGVFRTKDDQWVSVSAAAEQPARRLLTVIGGPALADDPRFSSNAARVENVEALETCIAGWIAQHSEQEVLEIFEKNDVVAGPLYDIERIVDDAHYRHRESIVRVEDPDLGGTRVQSVIPKFGATPGAVRHLAHKLGGDTDEILRDRLGLSAAQLATLRDDGII